MGFLDAMDAVACHHKAMIQRWAGCHSATVIAGESDSDGTQFLRLAKAARMFLELLLVENPTSPSPGPIRATT
jgi:hypothetical protein